MNARRIVFFITLSMVTCCLAIGGQASPAAAKQIIVTTLTDTADPPFNADGLCGSGTVSDLPGADGLVSLREAIIAANNTPGATIITFAPNLSGGTIMVNFDDLDADTDPDPLPALCGGHTRINGDINGDGVPDITLEGAAFPAATGAAGLLVLSSHNTIEGLQVAHFPRGIFARAGDFTTPGTIKHTTVANNIVVDPMVSGIGVRTGDAPGSRITDTVVTRNRITGSASATIGIAVIMNLSPAGSDTAITHTTITDNETTGTGCAGIAIVSFGGHNAITDATIARNTASLNGCSGIDVIGGFRFGAGGNATDVRISDNITANNACAGIVVNGSDDDSSNNRVVVRVQGNTAEQNGCIGIDVNGGIGIDNLPTGTSNNNEVDVRIEQNLVRNNGETGIGIFAGVGNIFDESPGGIAEHNHVNALIRQNVVEANALIGLGLHAGGPSTANANTLNVQVEHNTVCHHTRADILEKGGFTGQPQFPTPNQGSGNELTGAISKNTATTVIVEDGTPGNTATVTQVNNVPCP